MNRDLLLLNKKFTLTLTVPLIVKGTFLRGCNLDCWVGVGGGAIKFTPVNFYGGGGVPS